MEDSGGYCCNAEAVDNVEVVAEYIEEGDEDDCGDDLERLVVVWVYASSCMLTAGQFVPGAGMAGVKATKAGQYRISNPRTSSVEVGLAHSGLCPSDDLMHKGMHARRREMKQMAGSVSWPQMPGTSTSSFGSPADGAFRLMAATDWTSRQQSLDRWSDWSKKW